MLPEIYPIRLSDTFIWVACLFDLSELFIWLEWLVFFTWVTFFLSDSLAWLEWLVHLTKVKNVIQVTSLDETWVNSAWSVKSYPWLVVNLPNRSIHYIWHSNPKLLLDYSQITHNDDEIIFALRVHVWSTRAII